MISHLSPKTNVSFGLLQPLCRLKSQIRNSRVVGVKARKNFPATSKTIMSKAVGKGSLFHLVLNNCCARKAVVKDCTKAFNVGICCTAKCRGIVPLRCWVRSPSGCDSMRSCTAAFFGREFDTCWTTHVARSGDIRPLPPR